MRRYLPAIVPSAIAGGLFAWLWINRTFVFLEESPEMPNVKLYPREAPYAATIARAESDAGVPSRLLASLLYQESHYRPDIISGAVRSSKKAMGIAQFMPDTAREWLGMPEAALDPYKAIPAAGRYLAWCKKYTGGTWRDAVMAYNWGPGAVKTWIANGRPALKVPLETRKYAVSVYDTIYA